MATTLLLVRHASHEVLGRILCGRAAGIHISAEGRVQAARLATHLGRQSPALVLTSPRERCRETAAAIAAASKLSPVVSDALDEIDFGNWTGLDFDQLSSDPAWTRWNLQRECSAPPGGESMRQAQRRAVAEIQRVQAEMPNHLVVAVSHADIVKALISWCLGLTLDAHARFDIDPASVSTLHLWENGGKVARMNEAVA